MGEPEKEPPLTDGERRAVREMLERDRRASWAWSTLRVWSTWIVAVIAAVTVGWEFLRKIVRAAVE